MKLMTKAIEKQLLASSQGVDDPIPVVKYFAVWCRATWLIVRATKVGDELVLYGLCDLGMGEPEMGEVLLSELESVSGPLGLKVERALYWSANNHPISKYAEAAKKAGRITEIYEWKQSKWGEAPASVEE